MAMSTPPATCNLSASTDQINPNKMHSVETMNLVTLYFRLTLLHGEYVARYTYHFVISESNITT